MSGVEEGGGEPSSGNTPDKKAPTPVQHRSPHINLKTSRHILHRTATDPMITPPTENASNFYHFLQLLVLCSDKHLRSPWFSRRSSGRIIRLLLPVQFDAGGDSVIFPRELIVLAKGMTLPVVGTQNPPEIRMILEMNSQKIVRLAPRASPTPAKGRAHWGCSAGCAGYRP